jgi:hypothetical protein
MYRYLTSPAFSTSKRHRLSLLRTISTRPYYWHSHCPYYVQFEEVHRSWHWGSCLPALLSAHPVFSFSFSAEIFCWSRPVSHQPYFNVYSAFMKLCCSAAPLFDSSTVLPGPTRHRTPARLRTSFAQRCCTTHLSRLRT